ncbi:GAF and ANTAR domain-containing protein [Kribbella sp. NPDC004875]|uniref:GAF and ANTAR domain-containing protein n=1 Tax=Kribbella sp. NPDC004875 TaxID=3364107 RepID=UPI00368CEEED
MRSDGERLVRPTAATFGDVALRLHSAREMAELLVVTADLAAEIFACPLVGVATLSRGAALLDVVGTAAGFVRAEAAEPASAWHRTLDAGESLSVDASVGIRDIRALAPGLTEAGVRELAHVPLVPGRGRAVGVLSLYWTGSPADATDLQRFATHVALAMETLWYQHRLQASIETHRVVSSSLGILMERYGIDSREAYDVLSKVSLEHRVKLRDIAVRVIDDQDLLASG